MTYFMNKKHGEQAQSQQEKKHDIFGHGIEHLTKTLCRQPDQQKKELCQVVVGQAGGGDESGSVGSYRTHVNTRGRV